VPVQGEAMTLDELIDATWTSLKPSLFRRTILGRRRCAELVMLACANFPDRELVSCTKDSARDKELRKELTDIVAAKYRQSAASRDEHDAYGMVFMSVVLFWAASAIVQYLVLQWWKKHFDAAAIRKQYGWAR
jgi:hypothetical protein